MSFHPARSFNDSCINITVSVPRLSSYHQSPADCNGNTQVVPDNDFTVPSFDDHAVPNQQFQTVETESFYNDFFDCIKTPEPQKFTQQYHVSSIGELKRLKQQKISREYPKKRSPWRLIIEEEDILTSSPVIKKPEPSVYSNKSTNDPEAFLQLLRNVGWKTGILPGQEYLDDLYEIARSRDDPMLLQSLESFLAATVENLLQKQSDNEKLDMALKRATEKNTEIALELEQEMEQQVATLEEKIRQEEKRKLQQQKQEANKQILAAQSELLAMEDRVRELEMKVQEKEKTPAIPDRVIDEMQKKDEENLELKKKLLEFQTHMALMRTEVAQMKAEYDEQAERLISERGTVLNVVDEQENLTRQLYLLHEANKKLHDTNDDLRSALDSQKIGYFGTPESPIKRSTSLRLDLRNQQPLYSSFRSDPGAYRSRSTNRDFDDTDDDSAHSLLPHDEDINEESLMTELMHAEGQNVATPARNMNRTFTPISSSFLETRETPTFLKPGHTPSFMDQRHTPIGDRESFIKQLEVLCDTNKRLGESNDQLRKALGMLSTQLRNPTPIQRMSPTGAQSAPVTPLRNKYSEEPRPQSTSSPRKVLLTKSGFHSLSTSRSMPDLSMSCENHEEEECSLVPTTTDDVHCKCGATLLNEDQTCEKCCSTDHDDVDDDDDEEEITESESSAVPERTIYSDLSEFTRICDCEEENCNHCTPPSVVKGQQKCEKSLQCYIEETQSLDKSLHHCQYGACSCEEQETDNPLEKSTQISDMQLLHAVEEIEPIEIQDDLTMEELVEQLQEYAVSNVCTKCQSEITPHETGVNICLCNNDSVNQLAESTILTDSDSSNNYSDQETTQPEFLNKQVKHVGESNELSMFSRRDTDEELDEDDMDDEELIRLVDQTNDEEVSVGSISGEQPITVEEKILEPRGLTVGADTSSDSGVSKSPSDFGSDSYDRMFKVVLAGDAAVGKSSFIIRLCKDKFYSALNSTLGVDFQLKTMKVDDENVALQLWDTAGQERFRSIAKSYFRRVDGVILLYDVTCENSFLDVRDWLESIESSSSRKIPVIICGNKIDLRQQSVDCGMPVVSREQGQRLAQEVGALFVETSAKDGVNINKACRELTKQLQMIDDGRHDEGITLEQTKPKKSGCCRS